MLSLLLGCACSVLACKGECSISLGEEVIKRLHKTAIKPPVRQVKNIDPAHGRIFIKEESLSPDDVKQLKDNSFIPPKRTPIKADQQTDVIYFKKDNK